MLLKQLTLLFLEELELFEEAMLLEDICRGREVCLSEDLNEELLLKGELPGSVFPCLY